MGYFGKTKDCGYIYRKLTKSMENLKIHYDNTVRDEVGNIIQYTYGGNCFNTDYMEKQSFDIILLSKKDFENKYKWDNINVNKSITKYISNEFKNLKNIRKYYRNLHYYNDTELHLPINTIRFIKQSKLQRNGDTLVDFEYYFKQIKLINKLNYSNDKNKIIKNINNYSIKLMKDLIFSKLSSKIIIQYEKLTTEQFDWVINKIIKTFYQSICEPGSSVGSIAGQSISEPTTQLSIGYTDEIIYRKNDKICKKQIGEFIDEFINNNPDREIIKNITKTGNSSILPLTEEDGFQVPSMNIYGELEWKPLLELSRHPPGGDLLKITTENDNTVISTKAHTFMKKNNDIYKPVRGDTLKIGDDLPFLSNSFMTNIF